MMKDATQRLSLGRAWAPAALVVMLAASGCYRGFDGESGAAADTDGSDPETGPDSAGESGGDTDGGDPDDQVPEDECAEVGEAPDLLARRLTTFEYANTVQDVIGVDIAEDAASILPTDIRVDGFSNTAGSQVVTFDHIQAYHTLAGTIVERIDDLPSFAAQWTSCTDFEPACQDELVRNLGLRAWRRPLSDDEIASFTRLFDAVQEENESFGVATGLVVRALLESPQFLYRLENETPDPDGGPTRALDDYEIASRLSYLLWSSAPDDALYAAAEQGHLRTTEEIEAQVARMLETPRARDTSIRYISDWLALDMLPGINRDPNLYPGFTPELAEQMAEETRRLFENIVWEQRAPLVEVLSADYTFLSPELATFYGLEPAEQDWALYDLAELPNRIGVLTHAGVLSLSAHGNRPSIVERGLFILRSVLCSDVLAPPAEIDTSMADISPDASEREKSEARLENNTCVGCHGQFDPIAYGFERFDSVGAYREADDLGNEVQTDGWFVRPVTGEQVPFQDVAELVDIIAADEYAKQCVGIRKPLQFAVGRPLVTGDRCAIEDIQAKLGSEGGTYQDLMLSIATHPSFRRVRTQ